MIQQPVSELRPRHDSVDGAAEAYYAADYDTCLAMVHGQTGEAAEALYARSAIRSGRETDALAVLEGALSGTVGLARMAEFLTLKGTALICLRQDIVAESVLERARGVALASGCATVLAEAEYCSAMHSWSQGRLDEIPARLVKILALPSDAESRASANGTPNYVGNLAEVRAKAYDLLGALAAVRENFEEQASLVSMAFEELATAQRVDKFFESRLLLNYAVLARELNLTGSFEFVSHRMESFEFGPYTKIAEFQICRALGWCSAGRGDFLGAFRSFRSSTDAAPSLPFRIVAILDRALLARELHERHTAHEDLDYALRLYRSVDWEAVHGEERLALFVLAQHLAPVDPIEARRILDRFESIKARLPITAYGHKDRRYSAELSYATAQVLRAEGSTVAAVAALEDCYDVWTQIGYVARAAHAAADLADLTGNRHYVQAALRESDQKPRSHSSARLRSVA
jgi:tetratricopeptide (TPR) repeat protein